MCMALTRRHYAQDFALLTDALGVEHSPLLDTALAGYNDDEKEDMVSHFLGVRVPNRLIIVKSYAVNDLATKKARYEEEVLPQRIDPLTQLYNRRQFIPDLESAIHQVDREYDVSTRIGDPDVSLLILDVDKFKSINDTYGHGEGDRILVTIGDYLREIVNSTAQRRAYRIGGEEMALIISQTSAERGAEIAELVRSTIERELRGAFAERGVTVSIGLANYRRTCQFPDTHKLMRQADVALYQAKGTGRNKIEIYTSEMAERYRASRQSARS